MAIRKLDGPSPWREPAGTGETASAPGLGTRAFEERLDGLTNSTAREGNRVKLLVDAVNALAERIGLIDAARNSIHFQTFMFDDDESGWDLARRLARTAGEGVKVRVIYDSQGSSRSDKAIFDFMRRHGVEVRANDDPQGQKHLIVDGRVEYAMGGSGERVLPRGAGKRRERWRDVDARLEGPAVADAQRMFLEKWGRLGPQVTELERDALFPPHEVTGGARVRAVQDSHPVYLEAIHSARESIIIENVWFSPPQELRAALMDAARRGVAVKVMTNSRGSKDFGVVSDAARYFYDELIDAGVHIYQNQDATLHSSTATFDGVYSIVGSDSEVALGIEDPVVASGLQMRFAAELTQARQVTREDLRQEAFFRNLQQFTLSLLDWTF